MPPSSPTSDQKTTSNLANVADEARSEPDAASSSSADSADPPTVVHERAEPPQPAREEEEEPRPILAPATCANALLADERLVTAGCHSVEFRIPYGKYVKKGPDIACRVLAKLSEDGTKWVLGPIEQNSSNGSGEEDEEGTWLHGIAHSPAERSCWPILRIPNMIVNECLDTHALAPELESRKFTEDRGAWEYGGEHKPIHNVSRGQVAPRATDIFGEHPINKILGFMSEEEGIAEHGKLFQYALKARDFVAANRDFDARQIRAEMEEKKRVADLYYAMTFASKVREVRREEKMAECLLTGTDYRSEPEPEDDTNCGDRKAVLAHARTIGLKKGIWIHGSSGKGKSYAAEQMYGEAYYAKRDPTRWDGLEKEKIIVLQDISPNYTANSGARVWGDRLKDWASHTVGGFDAPVKGGFVHVNCERLIVTSNWSPAAFFAFARGKWITRYLEPILNRFTVIRFDDKWYEHGARIPVLEHGSWDDLGGRDRVRLSLDVDHSVDYLTQARKQDPRGVEGPPQLDNIRSWRP